jgi:hypothetical protein
MKFNECSICGCKISLLRKLYCKFVYHSTFKEMIPPEQFCSGKHHEEGLKGLLENIKGKNEE